MGQGSRLAIGQVRIREERFKQLIRELNGAQGLTIKARSDNTASVYVDTRREVSTETGYELVPGESVSADLLNPGGIFILAPNSGDRVCYLGLMA